LASVLVVLPLLFCAVHVAKAERQLETRQERAVFLIGSERAVKFLLSAVEFVASRSLHDNARFGFCDRSSL
jgi:hypothetical protein